MYDFDEINRAVTDEFRANRGTVGGQFADSDLLLLHHRGARTGTKRVSPVAYLHHDDGWLIVATMGGAPRNPAWYYIVKAHPAVAIEVGTETFAVVADEVADVDYAVVVKLLADRYPSLLEYQKLTTRRFPILRLTKAPARR